MKKLKWIIPLFIIAVLVSYFIVNKKIKAKHLEYTYTILKTGDIEAIVSSTGTLEAINTVEVGTQISGTIKKIYVDYNDKVVKEQILAEMDLMLLQSNLNNAAANLLVSEAQLDRTKDTYDRDKILYEKEVISEQEFFNSKFSYQQALSTRKAALANVNSIKVNIGYAYIKSPISGTITERSVEEGQTVAAAFATPKLFVIAEDLSKMQILADVDESDIGYLSNGMHARFTVQTYPDKVFFGAISQIRLQPIKINNVVNYKVVVDVDNQNGSLLPGMTASLEFITNSAKDVLVVNNSALRFHPNELMLQQIKPILVKKSAAFLPDSLQQKFLINVNDTEKYTPVNFKKELPSSIDGIFYEDQNGALNFQFIELGIQTGLESEIKRFLDDVPLKADNKVINSIKSNKK